MNWKPLTLKLALSLTVISALCCVVESKCQDHKIAVIKYPKTAVCVRSAENVESDTVGILQPGDLFSFKSASGDWSRIYKPTYFDPVEGYVATADIQPIDELTTSKKRTLIHAIFTKELEIIKTEDLTARENHHEPKFDFILNFASHFIVQTKDAELARLFIETVKIDNGSADEMPSWTLGWMYLQEPDWTIEQIKKVGIDKQLVGRLEFGFDNVTYDRQAELKNYQVLKEKIEQLK